MRSQVERVGVAGARMGATFCYLGGRDAGGQRWPEGDGKQNGGLQAPNKGERSTLQSVSPENAAVNGQAAGRRLFGLKRE